MPKVSVIIPINNTDSNLDTTLYSLQQQTFRDFEVLMVGDDLGDAVREIVDRYCGEDKRFLCKSQTAPGVPAARNAGLEAAAGEYAVFYDVGDAIPENALADLNAAAKKEFSDMVIGLAETQSLEGTKVPAPLYELAGQDRIDRYDPNLHHTPQLWNKMFWKGIIDEHNLRFMDLSIGSERVFTYQFEQACDSIAGCNSVIYQRINRTDWDSETMRQPLDRKLAEDLLRAFDVIEETVEKAFTETVGQMKERGARPNELEEFECSFRLFREAMFVRFTNDDLLGSFYRTAWRLQPETIALLGARVNAYKNNIFPGNWAKRIDGGNRDLALDKKILLSTEELAEDPIVSIVVSSGVPANQAGELITSIYNQDFPAFEVVVDETLTKGIDPFWTEKCNFYVQKHNENLSDFKNETIGRLKGRYVMFIDDPVIFTRSIIREMYRAITKKIVRYNEDDLHNHFVAVPLKHRDGYTCSDIESNNAAYVNEFVKIRFRSIYNQLDYFWSNKLFNLTYLRGKKVLFTGDAVKDIGKLYNNSNYTKLPDLCMVTSADDRDALKRVSNPWAKINYRSKIRRDERIKAKIAAQEVRIETAAQKFKNWRLQRMRYGFRFLTRKILYPLYYKWNARKPIDEKKVLFIEPRLDKLTNSIMEVYNYIQSTGEYTIHEHYLRDRYARYRHQYQRSMAFIKDFATAKYVIIAEANNTLGCLTKRPETIVVNTWHGCGAFKKFGFSTAEKRFGGDMKEKLKYPLYRNLDIVTVSSPEVVWAFEEAMGLQGQNVVKPLGVSRTDVFFDEEFVQAAVERVHKAVPATKDKKIIFYAPTFRGRIASAEGPDMLDVDKMAKELGDEYVLIVKHHPLVKRPPLLPPDVKDVFAFDLTREGSIDDLICASDICISDYSSLVYEYSLFERPMIFFAYDLDDYFDWRGFYYDYEDLTPGPIVTGTEEIIHYIKNIDTLFDKQEVRDFRDRFMSSCDGHATERIIDMMKEMGEARKKGKRQ